jgi:hypothetical protein
MFETLATAYVQVFATLLPALVLGILGVGAVTAGLSLKRASLALGLVALTLGLWHALVIMASKAGLLMPPPSFRDPPFALIPLLGGAFLLWAMGRLTVTGRAILDGLDQRLLIGFQIPRLMGGIFLLGWAMGVLPWQFALPAGLGDMWAGWAAIQAVRALSNNAPNAERLVRRANIIGLTDFVVAVTTGLMTSAGFIHILARDTPNIINAYPLALFPGYFVPIFIAFQLFSIGALRRSTQRHTTLRHPAQTHGPTSVSPTNAP